MSEIRCSARRRRAAATISIARVILFMFLTDAMRFLTSFCDAIGDQLLALSRGRRLLVLSAVAVIVGPGLRALGASRRLALLFGVDAVGLALLERVAVLVEVGAEVVDEVGDRLTQRLLVVLLELAGLFDPAQQLGLLRVQAGPQVGEELADALDFDPVEVAAGARVDRGDLVADREPFAACQRFLGLGVELGAELGEGLEVAVLGEVEAQFSGDLLHRLGLRVAADARDRDADVDRRADAREEEVGLQEDLAVGDRDHVGRDVGGAVGGLGLDDRQRRQRTAAELVVELHRPLQEPRVQVEGVTGVGLATRRAPQQQRHLPVGGGVFGEVVVDAEGGFAVVEEVLAHRAAGVGGDVLDRRRLVGRRGDDDRVLHRAVFLERLFQLDDGRHPLADGHVDADQVLVLVVDDRVDRDSRLAGLAVADDQLSLAAADRDPHVDRHQPRMTGISSSLPVRLTVSPSTISSQAPNSTAPTLSASRFSARPVTPCGSSSISSAMQLSSPWMRAMPSATDRTVPTSVRSADSLSSPSIRSRRMLAISSGLISIGGSLPPYAAWAPLFRSFSRRLRMLASKTMLPTCRTMPPRMPLSTLLDRSTSSPV